MRRPPKNLQVASLWHDMVIRPNVSVMVTSQKGLHITVKPDLRGDIILTPSGDSSKRNNQGDFVVESLNDGHNKDTY